MSENVETVQLSEKCGYYEPWEAQNTNRITWTVGRLSLKDMSELFARNSNM